MQRNNQSAADGMRIYIRRRRHLLGYTQANLATAIEVPYRTYVDFECGITHELRASVFARAVDILNIPIEHIKKLGKGLSTDEADQLATESLSQPDHALITEQVASMPDQALAEAITQIEQFRFDLLALTQLNSRIAALILEVALCASNANPSKLKK